MREPVAAVDDDLLMARYRAGDLAAFESLYQRYRGLVYRFFLRQLPQADAEECHQEVWLKVIEGADGFRAQGQFRAWLFTIAHHALTDRHRRAMRHAAIDPDVETDGLADPAPGPEADTEQALTAARLHRLVAALPLAQREALLLKESAGLSLAEIAAVTGATEEGVKSRLRYAMQKLRDALGRS